MTTATWSLVRCTRNTLIWSLTALAGFALAGGDATAQKLSGRAITFIVPSTPGTGPDIVARTIGEELQRRWGRPVVIDNKPGATGKIGAHTAARAAPDGHTLLITGPFTQNISLFKNLPYDPVKSFTPIMKVAAGSIALTVHPSVPATSTQEFVDYVKGRGDGSITRPPGSARPITSPWSSSSSQRRST